METHFQQLTPSKYKPRTRPSTDWVKRLLAVLAKTKPGRTSPQEQR